MKDHPCNEGIIKFSLNFCVSISEKDTLYLTIFDPVKYVKDEVKNRTEQD